MNIAAAQQYFPGGHADDFAGSETGAEGARTAAASRRLSYRGMTTHLLAT